jgi:hypothetical protein
MWTQQEYDRARICALEIANTLGAFAQVAFHQLDSPAVGGCVSGPDLCQLRLKNVHDMLDRWIDDNPLDLCAVYPLAVLLVDLAEALRGRRFAECQAIRRELYDSLLSFLDYVDRLAATNRPRE